MKTVCYRLTIGFFLLNAFILLSGCKKDLPPAEFMVTSTSVTLQTGEAGVEFYAFCTTLDVKISKVEILDPTRSNTIIYNLNSITRNKGENFALQDVGISYSKIGGIYQFTFTGNRVSDNSGFATVTTLNVAKK
jgi:hypothetical protein